MATHHPSPSTAHPSRAGNVPYHPYLSYPTSSPNPFSRRSSLELYPRSPIALPPSDEDVPSVASRLQTWLPLILWVLTTIGFFLAITVWRTELFQALDDFSTYLKTDIYYGYSIIFTCIFITTFPPFPLYSTLIVLSGYTFGAWTGFIISYSAALSGAVVVYFLSLHFCHAFLSDMLNRARWIRRIVAAIDKRPTLLFLIRLAPYPYNLLNAVLAASPTLTFKTYFTCTALSLFKLIIHTSAGSTIHHFAQSASAAQSDDNNDLMRWWSYLGLLLSIGIFAYLSYLAKKTVEEQADDTLMGEMRQVEESR